MFQKNFHTWNCDLLTESQDSVALIQKTAELCYKVDKLTKLLNMKLSDWLSSWSMHDRIDFSCNV